MCVIELRGVGARGRNLENKMDESFCLLDVFFLARLHRSIRFRSVILLLSLSRTLRKGAKEEKKRRRRKKKLRKEKFRFVLIRPPGARRTPKAGAVFGGGSGDRDSEREVPSHRNKSIM